MVSGRCFQTLNQDAGFESAWESKEKSDLGANTMGGREASSTDRATAFLKNEWEVEITTGQQQHWAPSLKNALILPWKTVLHLYLVKRFGWLCAINCSQPLLASVPSFEEDPL